MAKKKALAKATQAADSLPDVSAWHVELLRLTIFPVVGPKESGEGWWESVVGAPSEVRSSQPRQSIVQEAGPYLGGTLTLNVSPLRVDWLLTPPVGQDTAAEDLPVVGEFPKLADAYANAMSKWLASENQFKRIAFGAVLLQRVNSHEEGYSLVDRYLPAVDLDPRSADFMYQINRARDSNVVSGLRLNRLNKWSVARIQGLQLQFESGGKEGGRVVSGATTKDVYCCRLELDMNTSATHVEPFPGATGAALFGELVGMGLEIASRGDLT